MSLKFTELQEGESIVFGPITTTRSANVSAGQGSVSHTSGRTVGVTTLRVIAEDLDSPDKTQILANTDVKQVAIKRHQGQAQSSITLVSVTTPHGHSVKLDIKGLPAQAETLIKKTFPNAEIHESKGSKVLLIIGIVIAAIILLACVVPMLVPLILRIFGGGG